MRHADETGRRVNGQTHWLWCFANHAGCYSMIDEGRGSGALKKFFTESFRGVLIHDFWRPYASVLLEGPGEHQCCLAHLLRELEHVDEHTLPHKPPDRAVAWSAFVKMLRRLLRDGVRLRRRPDCTPERYRSRIVRIDARLRALSEAAYDDPDASRLAARLSRHQDELFTFLDRPEANGNNNLAERMLRPAVILRNSSQCNRSQRGAATQAVLMTIYRILKLRGHDPARPSPTAAPPTRPVEDSRRRPRPWQTAGEIGLRHTVRTVSTPRESPVPATGLSCMEPTGGPSAPGIDIAAALRESVGGRDNASMFGTWTADSADSRKEIRFGWHCGLQSECRFCTMVCVGELGSHGLAWNLEA